MYNIQHAFFYKQHKILVQAHCCLEGLRLKMLKMLLIKKACIDFLGNLFVTIKLLSHHGKIDEMRTRFYFDETS